MELACQFVSFYPALDLHPSPAHVALTSNLPWPLQDSIGARQADAELQCTGRPMSTPSSGAEEDSRRERSALAGLGSSQGEGTESPVI